MCVFVLVSSQPGCRAQHGVIPPHEVLTLRSGQAALHRVVSVPGSAIGTQREAEASCAVADLEEAVRTEESISLAASQVVDRLQVIVDCNVVQLLPSLHPPSSPPQEKDACDQNQHQDRQEAGDGDGGGGRLGGLTQSGLETGLKCELATWTHEALRTLAYRPSEVGEASASILARTSPAGIRADTAVLASVP